MKILHLAYSGLGGTANVVFSMIEAGKAKKVNQSLILSGPKLNSDYSIKLKNLNTKFEYVKTSKHLFILSYLKILKKIFKFKPNIITIHNYQLIPCLIYKLLIKNIKIVYVNHQPLSNHGLRDIFVIKVARYIDKIILLNRETFLIYKKIFNKNLNKLDLIFNGININFFSKSNRSKNRIFKIGMACRLNKQKKYDIIIKALKTKSLNKLKIQLSLAGDGEELINIKKMIKQSNLQKKIECTGYLNEKQLKKWYETLDLYIQASSGEAMSTSILQAMSMKIPILASNVTGINEIIGKSKYLGMLFENNKFDLSKKIRFFYLLSVSEKNKFIQHQYKCLKKKYSHFIMFEKYYKIFNRLLKK